MTEPRIEIRGRSRAEAALLLLEVLFGLLALRLFVIQVVDGPRHEQAAERQHFRVERLGARRGDILFADGTLAATTVPSTTIYAVPQEMDGDQVPPARRLAPTEVARRLGQALGLNEARTTHLARRLGDPRYRRFAYVTRQVGPEDRRRVAGMDLPGVHFEEEGRRVYPARGLAAQVLGLTDIDGRGLEGVERELDPVLRGQDGERRRAVDGMGRPIAGTPGERVQEAVPGLAVRLTIDPTLQHYLESAITRAAEEHRPRGAWGVVLSVPDARVLALVSWPGFDPNRATSRMPDRIWNHALRAYHEPGSTVKPLILAAALARGVVSTEERIDCEQGLLRVQTLLPGCRRRIRDAHPHGVLSLEEIISLSSNIGMTKIGVRMGATALRETLLDYGFGRPTGIELPLESPGRVTPPARWNDYTTTSVPWGQELGATGLQLAAAFHALAADGAWRAPRLLDGPIPPARQVIPPEVAALVRDYMVTTVDTGTGKRAAVPGHRIGGKTGTSQKFASGRLLGGQYVGSFCAIAPADRPRMVVVVQLDEPQGAHYGGVVAAPAVRAFLEQALPFLGVPPEPAETTGGGRS